MKVTRVSKEPSFTPITMEITVETVEELEALRLHLSSVGPSYYVVGSEGEINSIQGEILVNLVDGIAISACAGKSQW